MHASLMRLQQMATHSREMVVAARANDWERLAELEHAVAGLRNAWMADEPTGRQPAGLSEDEQRLKATLIEQMLADDIEVRLHAEPFLESTRKLLSGAVLDNNVRKAYGAFGP